ncbi:M15 family metallopeptidase [Sanguibacter suaedae]|uniref:D-alanyl-D-alanine carboxypeptidase family protein n=1 Tax=Sanguibacter suaedae TaxID=2795737 RepID=A0A934I6A1_9MICO|nr:M15 family metallopeptidase [Sanguibacter suaedae]MBI9116058.1 D-alanyl-D-alanine carboxypeptidase family protein [Sanguibacter suaedae]
MTQSHDVPQVESRPESPTRAAVVRSVPAVEPDVPVAPQRAAVAHPASEPGVTPPAFRRSAPATVTSPRPERLLHTAVAPAGTRAETTTVLPAVAALAVVQDDTRPAAPHRTGTAERSVDRPQRPRGGSKGSGAVRRGKTTAQRTKTLSPGQRWIPRAAVLTSLAVATIAVPLSAGAGGGGGESTTVLADAEETAGTAIGPSTLQVVGSAATDAAPPESLAQAIPEEQRTVQAASRSEIRTALPGCDISVEPSGTNGNLAKNTLCELWGTGNYLRADAAEAMAALNQAYAAEFGGNMCITDSYRTLASQYAVKSQKGALAATPGKSEHGWGLAVDICPESYQATSKWNWLKTNGPLFGWDNPAWARAGGSGSYEPWHWEFTTGVENKG